MSNMSEDIQYAGSDTRPPMLDRTDFESWQQRIRLYCLGKDNGENIMKPITEGPFQMGTMRDTLTKGGEGALHLGPERARVFADLSAEQKDRYKADIRAMNILLQGIPKDLYTLINHFTNAKDIWDNVKMILEGSELTKDDRESQLYDEFERFCQIKGETIHILKLEAEMSKVHNESKHISKLERENINLQLKGCSSNYNATKSRDISEEHSRRKMCNWGMLEHENVHNQASQDSDYFKGTRCVMDAHATGVAVLDEEQLLFLAGELVTNYDDDVQDHDTFVDHMDEYHEVHEMQNDVQHNYVVDSDADYTSDSNIIPYDQYVEDNEEHVIQSNVSFVRNDALMSILDEMHE
ncbi:hypothetical protein Tco_0341168 [Tanacetum coccineum]